MPGNRRAEPHDANFFGDHTQVLYLLYTLHVIVCLFLILVVLLQQGKGADLSVFGGGGTQAAFGPRGATTLLHKLTVWGFIAFTVMTISIGFLTGRGRGGSVMEGVETEQSAPATPAPEPAAGEPAPGEPNVATPTAEPPATPAQSEPTAPGSETDAAEGRAAAAGTDDDAASTTDDAAQATEETAPPASAEESESTPDETPQ